MCITKFLYNHTRFDTSYIKVNGRRLKIYKANSTSRMMIGLMYRPGLSKGEGMLFYPGNNARHGIWMQNMKFPIDIVWLSGEGRVVDIKERAAPCKSIFSCPTYKPEDNARYVLEIAAGASKALRIKKGTLIGVPSD